MVGFSLDRLSIVFGVVTGPAVVMFQSNWSEYQYRCWGCQYVSMGLRFSPMKI